MAAEIGSTYFICSTVQSGFKTLLSSPEPPTLQLHYQRHKEDVLWQWTSLAIAESSKYYINYRPTSTAVVSFAVMQHEIWDADI